MRNFWFSYQNILKKEIIKKNYFKFFRKIFVTIYKFIIKYLRIKFSTRIKNLDKINIENFSKLNLNELFINFNCDKGSSCFFNGKKIESHNYSIFYEKYFREFKYKPINLLEIGSHEGKGLASFFFYFPNSNLVGANINPFQMRFFSKRITELFVDVSSTKILKSLSNHLEQEPDIIIDDASHNLRDMLITFSIFFKKLRRKGVYVIEDMNQFKIYKNLNPYIDELSVYDILNKIMNNEDFHSSFIDNESKSYIINNIRTIKIEKGSMVINKKNVSDIAFIFKK